MVNKADFIWMDGELIPWDDANVHVLTHTLHYGVGVFEGVRSYRLDDGRSAVFRLDEHVERLFASASLVMMQIPFSEAEIREAILETLRKNDLKEAYIRPIAFIGSGRMGLFAFDNPIQVAIAAWKWGAYLGDDGLARGIRATVSSFKRHHPNSAMPKGKICGQYVNSILAKREAMLAGFDEAILLDADGMVSEASGENVFIVHKGVIKTPPYSSAILGGITRESILTLAHEAGYKIDESVVAREKLYLADEMFMTGTAAEVTPVREVDHRVVGSGEPGPVTKDLQDKYFAAIRGRAEGHDDWLAIV